MNNKKTCKTCEHWDIDELTPDINDISNCNFVNNIYTGNNSFYIDAYAKDDTGLETMLITGRNFGCVNHKQL